MKSTQVPRQKAVLVGVQLPRVSDQETQASLQELARLVQTLGLEVIGNLSQKRPSLAGGIVIGEGKLVELAKWTGGTGRVESTIQKKKSKAAERFSKAEDDSDEDTQDETWDGPHDAMNELTNEEADESDSTDENRIMDATEDLADDSAGDASFTPPAKADVVVFDCELTPSQLRNLESATGAQVLDRTGVIIEIFSRHARTRAAQLQVEIARLAYLAPRLRETGGADRQGGGIGAKGAGETSAELDRRRIRDRIKELKRDLESVQHEDTVRRARRAGENCVALVGYTNAGKSSLMRAMTGSEIYVADKLFATLETTVRPLHPETRPRVLLSDTVGFIKKLPHDLVASFRSTLDEALNADLLLYVVDSADPTFRAQLAVTHEVIKEIGASETPSRLVLNKRDKLTTLEITALKEEFPDAIVISTRDPADLAALREILVGFFERDMVGETLFVPYGTQAAIGEIRSAMRVLDEGYDEQGTTLRVRATKEILARYHRKFDSLLNERR